MAILIFLLIGVIAIIWIISDVVRRLFGARASLCVILAACYAVPVTLSVIVFGGAAWLAFMLGFPWFGVFMLFLLIWVLSPLKT